MRFPSVLIAVALAAACGQEERGELMLVIDSDLTPGGTRPDFDALQIHVTNDDYLSRKYNEFGAPGQPTTFPATFAIIAGSDPKLAIHLRIYAGIEGGGETPVGAPVLLRELVTTVPYDRVAALHIPLQWACLGNAYDKGLPDHYVEGRCAEGSTCLSGSCVEWTIDSSLLADYSREKIFGGACFDTLACLTGGSTVALDLTACTAQKPAGVTGPINVGIVSADGHGICDPGGTCYVPLDADPVLGWQDLGASVKLPAGYCHPAEGVAAGRIRSVVISSACPPKAAPTCGPWSALSPSP